MRLIEYIFQLTHNKISISFSKIEDGVKIDLYQLETNKKCHCLVNKSLFFDNENYIINAIEQMKKEYL